MKPSLQIQASALLGFTELVQASGADPGPLLAPFGLAVADIHQAGKRIAVSSFVQLLQASARTLGQDDFGMRLGFRQDFQILGSLGVLLQNCTRIGEALQAVKGFMAYHNQAEIWEPCRQGDQVHFRRHDLFRDLPDSRQYKELAIAACLQFFRLGLTSPIRDLRIEFSHAPLASQASYAQHYRVPITFNCEYDAVVFPARYLDEPLKGADDGIRQLLEQQLRAAQHNGSQAVAQQVTRLIKQSMGAHPPTIAHTAALMGMNKRTLQRRLKAEGIEFKALLAEIRVKTACWYLASSDIDITLLAAMLGYSDVSNFSRAFKAASGRSPRHWRLQAASP